MVMLDKETSLFKRDENGNLIARTVTLELLNDKPEIKITPMLRGEIQRLMSELKGGETNKQQDEQIIMEHCKEPIYTKAESSDIKPKIAGAIVTAILAASLDITQKKLEESSKAEMIKQSDMLSKKD